MLISVTGTPGTGKTKMARKLAKLLKAKLVSQNDIIKKMKTAVDKQRKTKIVDERKIRVAAENMLSETTIIEGHLSHYSKPDIVIVLRCRPDILEKRLKARRYSKSKVIENVQSEILDSATIESMDECKSVWEIDTTMLTPEKAAGKAARIILSRRGGKSHKPGNIDWTRKWKKYLIYNS